ncbi:MAG: hypothetical protein SFV17_17295 [Candidatus Obscuribacter sp.]|nr:hypothetical protein [Candidatus Obscuribacter sp.]
MQSPIGLRALGAQRLGLHRPWKTFKTSKKVLAFTALFLSFVSLASSPCQARDYYISPTGDGTTGLSWSTALRHIPPLNFGISPIQPGDRIILDGGVRGVTYTTALDIGVSGTATNPITIMQSPEPGHNGRVTLSGFVGGAQVRLPVGVRMAGSHIRMYGSRRGGLRISDYLFQGVAVTGSNNWLSNLEIAGVYGPIINPSKSPGLGLLFAGNNNVYKCLDIFNCLLMAQQGFPTSESNSEFDRCWFFDTYNRSAGGFVVNGGREDSRVEVSNCVFGPGLAQGLINKSASGFLAVNGSLFLNASQDNVLLAETAGTSRTVLRRNTAFMTDANNLGLPHNNLNYNGNGNLTVVNSIFYGGLIRAEAAARARVSGNFQYNVLGNTVLLAPALVDPQFREASVIRALQGATPLKEQAGTNFALADSSPATGKGARATAVSILNKAFTSFFVP